MPELKAGDYTSTDLKLAKYGASQMRSAGFTASEMRLAGCSPSEMHIAGYTAIEMRESGFSAKKVFGAGCVIRSLTQRASPPRRLLESCHPRLSPQPLLWPLRDARWPWNAGSLEFRTFSTANLLSNSTPSHCYDLLSNSVPFLAPGSYTATEATEAGWSVEVLRSAGYDARQLREAKISAGALRAVGFALDELREAGYESSPDGTVPSRSNPALFAN